MNKARHATPCVTVILAIVALSVVFASCRQDQEIAHETIRIGAPLSLTGSAAVWGQRSRNGIELAVTDLANEGIDVAVTYEDTASESKGAVAALNKLIAQGIRFVVGDVSSSNVLAMAPLAEANQVLLVSSGASNPDISAAGEYIFRTWQSDAAEGGVDAEFAKATLGWEQVAIVYVENAYGQGLQASFRETFDGSITMVESFAQGQDNFRNLVAKLGTVVPDGLYLPGYPEEMGVFLKQLREQGLAWPVLATQAFDDPLVLEAAGPAAEGVIFSVPKPPNPDDPVVHNFREAYRARFNEDPGVTADAAYDAAMLLGELIAEHGYDPQAVKGALYSVDRPGASGQIKFNEAGDLIRDFVFRRVVAGEFTPFEPATSEGNQ